MTSSPPPTSRCNSVSAPGDDDLLVGGQHLLTDQIAHGQPVRVGGHHAQAIAFGGHHHAGEDRPCLVGAGGAHRLAQRGPELGGRQRDRGVDRRCQLRVVIEAEWPHREVGPTVADRDVVALDNHIDLALAQRTNDVGSESRRQHHPTVALATHLDRQLDREIEVGARDRQLVANELEPEPGEHGQGAGTTGGCTTGGGQRLGQRFTFTTELHSVPFRVMG